MSGPEGQKVSLRPDWEDVKLDIMYQILKLKFNNPSLKHKLLDTDDTELIEGNIWGVDIHTGKEEIILENYS